ncbi:prephenate dehydrogenase [Siphonobacter sp. BAB-5405]|uniref:prephenate dehydrogenase n=1 Tax=Siphonobacter sp. BAB-5405 TaxID=1864825 RepID=UPI000C801571|nr:prephenate dehydrogenase [Siphonobacter sp. BAB-5405]PMD95739.1 prephenate dehydrogenase [Siphonobacter sp. BAB-5405]
MTIAIVGIGLIGGSMALALKESGYAQTIIGVDKQVEHVVKALELKLVDKVALLDDAINQSDLIILAVPVDGLLSLLPYVLDRIDKQIVIDVGSTKRPIVEAVKNHPNRRRFVATHPMAGTEYSGPEAAVRGLFTGKYNVICDAADSDSDAVATVKELYEAIGMKITEFDSTSHDVHTAYISHISHICSFALALTTLEKEKEANRIFELASSGFASTVRLAKSSPETWIPIFRQNRENILDVLDEYINNLLKFKGLMLSDSYEKFQSYLKEANDIQRILE